MAIKKYLNVRQLDTCIPDRESLTHLRGALDKVEKCCVAIEKGHHVADIFHDPANWTSFIKAFGEHEFEHGLQLLFKVAMGERTIRSFTIQKNIEGRKRLEFLYRSFGGWKQFDTVILFQFPENTDSNNILFLNPVNGEHWGKLSLIPEGTLISVAIRTAEGARSPSQETLAAERYQSVFEAVQSRSEAFETSVPEPVIQLRTNERRADERRSGHLAKPKSWAKSTAPSIQKTTFNYHAATKGPPVMSFKIVINKMDTFVHAGNAQLIVTHLRNYQGKAAMFVLRAEKKEVRLDADSIWGAEIRNGETVLFEFFGPAPDEAFVKDLAKKVNKYTQMDKLGDHG